MQTLRRLFILNTVTTCATLAGARLAAAQAAPALVKEDEPTAVALGYVTDAARIDTKKQPVFVPGSSCGSCALFQGKAGDASGACPVFGGKLVAAKGWCTGWSKKA
jgi:High potential iron-sulfur protein